jgi:hypothetical protein
MKMFCVANKGYRCAAPTKVTGALHLAIMYGICCVTKITGATHLQRLSVLRTYKGYRCYAPSADVWALLCYQCYRCSAPSADVWVLFCYQGYRCYAPKPLTPIFVQCYRCVAPLISIEKAPSLIPEVQSTANIGRCRAPIISVGAEHRNIGRCRAP